MHHAMLVKSSMKPHANASLYRVLRVNHHRTHQVLVLILLSSLLILQVFMARETRKDIFQHTSQHIGQLASHQGDQSRGVISMMMMMMNGKELFDRVFSQVLFLIFDISKDG